MPLTEVYQQSLLGDVWSLITLPFRIVWKIVGWIFSIVLSILLIPFRVLQWFYYRIKRLIPVIYAENIYHSFKGLLCVFSILLIGLTVMLIALSFLHVIPLAAVQRILGNFDLWHALGVMGKTFAITEGGFIGLAIGGFLLSFIVVFVLISGYSLLQTSLEILNGLTRKRKEFIIMFAVAVIIFVVLYLLLQGKIPL
ncbi:MAG: hypothetical protein GY801_30440 [bacterium]|nr:hypothetical protein [bacterium]